MKRNFNKEFKEEFKKSFDNALDKETLKENLNLVPQEDTIIFKKKPFYGLSSLFAALLIIVTASITFLVTYYADYNEDNFHCQSEEAKVMEFFQNKFQNAEIKFICNINSTRFINISFIRINMDGYLKICLYFHETIEKSQQLTTYKLSINESVFDGILVNNNQYVEYDIVASSNYRLNFSIESFENKICEFYIEF